MLAPAAISTETFQNVGTVRGAPLAPQLDCVIVFDAPGFQRCDVFGPVTNVNELRITMGSVASHVFVLVDDISGFPTRQMTWADCTGGCVRTFAFTTSTRVALYISATGGQGSTLAVSLETGTAGLLG